MKQPTLTYSIELPQKVEQILEDDWWVFTHLKSDLLSSVKEAVKFTSCVSVFIEHGTAEFEVNLLNVRIQAPCVVHIKPEQVLQLKKISPDFDASFIVLNERSRNSLLLSLHDAGVSVITRLEPVVPVHQTDVEAFVEFYRSLAQIQQQESNPYRTQAFHHSVLSFFFRVAYRCSRKDKSEIWEMATSFKGNTLVDRFLVMAQQHFKEERQIKYYADKLGVTAKHLSRLLKKHTGCTANEWMRNYILLEAKVMLKSSTLTMGQIAQQLNFPSQSFFAKYFKNATGYTPKQFRNISVDSV